MASTMQWVNVADIYSWSRARHGTHGVYSVGHCDLRVNNLVITISGCSIMFQKLIPRINLIIVLCAAVDALAATDHPAQCD